MADLKYLAAYSIPIAAIMSLELQGFWSFLTPVYAFAILPLLELVLPIDNTNLNTEQVKNKQSNNYYDWLLYLNIPIVYGILFLGLITVTRQHLELFELVGTTLSIGIVLGVNGINVGHELGHRLDTNERFLGKILLLPSLYMHFFIEHNFGHHLNAATKEDPATAKYNQSVYSFWWTSTTRQYFSAWNIQKKRLKNSNQGFFSFKNDMFWYLVFQSIYLLAVYLLFNALGLWVAIGAALVGFLLLETVNYIEHYGLLRLKTKSGRYERVKQVHSWNSNHILGRIVLYELTRHSDHHYRAAKKYQVLDCHEQSPQMPFGYPTSMVMALVPPLWFKVMNKRIPRQMISA